MHERKVRISTRICYAAFTQTRFARQRCPVSVLRQYTDVIRGEGWARRFEGRNAIWAAQGIQSSKIKTLVKKTSHVNQSGTQLLLVTCSMNQPTGEVQDQGGEADHSRPKL